MKKLKQLCSLVLICVMCFCIQQVHAEAEEPPLSIEEKLQISQEVHEILREVGVGKANENKTVPKSNVMAVNETIYAKVLKKNIGFIDIVDYNKPAPDGTPWTILERWQEGMLGASSGEPLYCANPILKFRAGNKTGVDASKYYNQKTIQMIAAMFYYYDQNMCSGINSDYEYLLKQCAVWWVLNEVENWYPNVDIETGNNVRCNLGHWISTHKSEYIRDGFAWARTNYMYFSDAYGIIFEGEGQPLSRWGGTYNPQGYAKLKKVSSDTKVTEGNSCYSLAGCEFGVYTDKNLSGASKVGVFTTDANGESNTLTLKAGTYYVKELKAPKGFALSAEVKEVAVTSGKTTTIEFKDTPQFANIEMLLKKVDSETNESMPQGEATFENAEFTVKYYSGMWKADTDPASLGQTPKRTWVFKTDKEGKCSYQKEYLVSGDELYLSAEGKPALPLGTVTIQETKSPEGYFLNEEIFVVQISSQGTGQYVDCYAAPIVPENIVTLELFKRQEGSEIAIPEAEFEHLRPDGTKEVIKTDQDGRFVIKGLQYGRHIITEIHVMDGYVINGNPIEFEVASDNQIKIISNIDNSLGKVEIEITEEGNISLLVEDPLSPFSLIIHKENEKGKVLSDAEFTLFSDKDCSQEVMRAVTEGDGILRMHGLEIGKTYYLQETKAPKGYRLPKDIFGKPIVYEIYTEATPVKDEFIFYVNGIAYDSHSDPEGMFTVTGTKAEREGNITVINETGKKLPNTGSKWMIPLILSGILCGGISALYYKKISNTKENKL